MILSRLPSLIVKWIASGLSLLLCGWVLSSVDVTDLGYALLAAIGMTGLGASSVIWFPPTLASSADQFGVMGVAFALLSWLVAAGFVLVIAACGGAVTTEWWKARRA